MPLPFGQAAMDGHQGEAAARNQTSKVSTDGTRRVRRLWRKNYQSSSSSVASRSGVGGTPMGEEQPSGTSRRLPRARFSRSKEPIGAVDAISTRFAAASDVAREDVTPDQDAIGRVSSSGHPISRDEQPARTEPVYVGAEYSGPTASVPRPPSTLSLAERRALEGPALCTPGVPVGFQDSHKEEAKCSSTLVGVTSLITTTVFVVAVLLILRFTDKGRETEDNVCLSAACAVYSKWLLDSMNDSIDPCQDFAGHVCDGWNKKHTLSVREVAFMAAFDRMSRLVRTVTTTDVGQKRMQRGARFYSSCDLVLKGERDELPVVKAALRQAGVVWPAVARNRDTLHLLLYVALKLHWSVLLPLGVSQREGGTEVVFHYPTDLIPMVRKYVEIRSNADGGMAYVQPLIDAFSTKSEGSAERQAKMKEFLSDEEYAIIRLHEDYATSSEPQPVNDSVLFSTVPGLTEARWKSVLGSLAINVTAPMSFRTELTSYVPAFFQVWTKIGDSAMHVLLSWMTVQLAALYANRRLILNFFGAKDAELRYGAFCYSRAYILSGKSVFSAYVRNMLVDNARAQAEDIALAVRQSFYKRLRHWPGFSANYSFIADWNSTEAVFQVFDDAPDSDGYANETSEQPTTDMTDSLVQNWINNAGPLRSTSTSASYAAIENLRFYMWMNDTVLLPYVFAFPLFDKDATVEMNYAGVGAELARATSDYFVRIYKDDHGVEDVKRFMECVANVSGGRGAGPADTAAVKAIAAGPLFDAYRRHSEVARRRLPGLEQYVGAKLFFIAYCYINCSGTSAAAADDADCNEILRHVPAFARVFACATGTPMNPTTQRCQLF